MSGVFYCRSEFTAPWGLELPPFEACMMFHVVTAGECWLEVDGRRDAACCDPAISRSCRMAKATACQRPGVRCRDSSSTCRESCVSERYDSSRHGGGGRAATMICGAVRFDHPAAHQLLRLLPRLINVDAWSSPEAEWMQSTLRFLTAEARELRAGGETVITRLADILVIQAIRSWIAHRSGKRRRAGSARCAIGRSAVRSH